MKQDDEVVKKGRGAFIFFFFEGLINNKFSETSSAAIF